MDNYQEIINIINSAIENKLLNKSDIFHNHDDLYHLKNEVYTKNEVSELIKTIIEENKKNTNEIIEQKYFELKNIFNLKIEEFNSVLKNISEEFSELKNKNLELYEKYNNLLNKINQSTQLSRDVEGQLLSLESDIDEIKEQYLLKEEYLNNIRIIESRVSNYEQNS